MKTLPAMAACLVLALAFMPAGLAQGDRDDDPQDAAMANAKRTLHDAVAKAVMDHKGARATGVVPTIQNGRPVATVRLLTGSGWSSVTEPLD